jgi:hypothetical protein
MCVVDRDGIVGDGPQVELDIDIVGHEKIVCAI